MMNLCLAPQYVSASFDSDQLTHIIIILLLYGQQFYTLCKNMKLAKSKTPQLSTISNNIVNTAVEYSEQTEVQMPLTPQIKDIIRRKVSSYLNCHITMTPPTFSKQLTSVKKNKPLPKEFAEYANLSQFMKDEKTAFHLYKQKIDRNMDQCLYFYLKLLCLAIDYECRISQRQIDDDSSVMIQAFLFVASSLFEAGAEKASFYFSTIAITFCEYYKMLHPIGEFLLIMAKINRKIFKYKESIVLLKKALQYNWWTDTTKTNRLNANFRRWLGHNYVQQLATFDEKYQIAKNSHVDNGFLLHRSHKVDQQLKAMRDLLHSYFQVNKMKQEIAIYDIIHKKPQSTNQRAIDLELEIYNQMSFNFLQLNKKEESKLFAEKYESGYTEPQDSKIILLSRELINSIQKRVTGWQQMNLKNFELLFFVDIFQMVASQRQRMRTMDQQIVLQNFKIIFQSMCENFVTKDMFQYQIPLPLQLKRQIARVKKHRDGKKFIVRQRSSSNAAKQNVQVLKKYSSDKVEQNLIFNYRGLKVSRLKLLDIYTRFVDCINERKRWDSFKE